MFSTSQAGNVPYDAFTRETICKHTIITRTFCLTNEEKKRERERDGLSSRNAYKPTQTKHHIQHARALGLCSLSLYTQRCILRKVRPPELRDRERENEFRGVRLGRLYGNNEATILYAYGKREREKERPGVVPPLSFLFLFLFSLTLSAGTNLCVPKII